MEHQAFDHDVLVIGAGGAGLRAAIEAAAAGVKVGMVCKSLLGKAHTVMAEGGVAAAMANVDIAIMLKPSMRSRWASIKESPVMRRMTVAARAQPAMIANSFNPKATGEASAVPR